MNIQDKTRFPMKDIYQVIVDFYISHPLTFWIGISLLLVFLIVAIRKIIKLIKTERIEGFQKEVEERTKYIIINKPDIKGEVRITENSTKGEVTIPENSEKEIKRPTPVKESKKKGTSLSTEIKAKTTVITGEVPHSNKKIKKGKENLPEVKEEGNSGFKDNLYVKYESSIKESTDNYPVFRIPQKGCIVRSHRFGSTKRRGFKDESFQSSIQKYFSPYFDISGKVRLNTGESTRPFEPDIAIIDKKSDKNIRIDIEIDEPYAGITRQPTHCKGEDFARDTYFIDRGWIVIRFSEYQVHTQEIGCLSYIAKIINSIDNSFIVPSDLISADLLKEEKMWDIVQAQKWEKDHYREKYLNHEFKVTPEIEETAKRGLNEQEKEEETFVKRTFIGVVDTGRPSGFNSDNAHKRDKRVRFYPECHEYFVDNVPVPSVSMIISKFFTEFDAYSAALNLSPFHELFGMEPEKIVQIWKERGQQAANDGTFLHEQIEKFYLGEEYSETEEILLFKKFYEDNPNLIPYRSEWRIFDERYHIAGTIDLIVKNGIGYEIYDWKRSKKVINEDGLPIVSNPFGRNGIGILNHISDTSYNRYCLQQSLYKYILENDYNIRISNMYLVVLLKDYTTYYKVGVPYMEDEINSILRAI